MHTSLDSKAELCVAELVRTASNPLVLSSKARAALQQSVEVIGLLRLALAGSEAALAAHREAIRDLVDSVQDDLNLLPETSLAD